MRKMFNAIGRYFKGDVNEVDNTNLTRLQNAILDNDIVKVRSLIKAGADVNLRSPKVKYPPLHLALLKNQQPIVLELMKAGAQLNQGDYQGQTPLHHAVEHGRETFIAMLLKAGANANAQDDAGRTPLHIVPTKRPQIVDMLARHGANMSAQDKQGNTPLHIFLEVPAMADKLLTNGADPNVKNNIGQSSYQMILDESRLNRTPETLHKMLALNANLDATNPVGETVLLLSARLGMDNALLNVMDRTELTKTDKHGNNVLHALIRAQNAAMIARVLKKAPDLVHGQNKRCMTPMDELISLAENPSYGFTPNFLDIARQLLNHKANPNAVDRHGRGLLHYAVGYDKAEFLDDALAYGANPNLVDVAGKTALHYAIERRNMRAMDVLLDLGADPDMTDARGWTILDRLAEKDDRDSPMVQRLIVGGGQYKKQLPLNPDQMRPKTKTTVIGVKEKPKPSSDGGSGPRF